MNEKPSAAAETHPESPHIGLGTSDMKYHHKVVVNNHQCQ
uniref:Uncharacterized protein n=1 Tax=Anguilla anguilla TaxID=7936 RepID=A0A0E9W0M6_ANGAN